VRIDWKNIGIKQLAALVSVKLRERGIDAILVGGACVSIYTKNRYLSFDLDFVTHATLKEVATALADVGFRRESSRHFIRSGCPFFIEFVAPPAAIGNEPVRDEFRLKTTMGTVVMLTPTDCVKDRLAAFYHWNDPQALEQALMVAKAREINIREVKRWSEKEGHADKYREFLNRLRSKR
jgi:hypothetical protein